MRRGMGKELPKCGRVCLPLACRWRAGQLCGRAGDSAGTCEGFSDCVCPGRMTQCEEAGRGGGGGGAKRLRERACARSAPAQALSPPAVPAPGPARSPRRPFSPDADARARRMRGTGCRVRGAAR